MNKRSIISILIFILVVAFIFIIAIINRNTKFSLDDKYYKNGGLEDVSLNDLENKIKNKESFVLFTYNDFCTFSVPCDTVFNTVSKKNNITILQIPFVDFKKSSLYKKVKYGPSVIIINKGKIEKYLDANSDGDKDLYQDNNKFYKWLSKYINIKKGE